MKTIHAVSVITVLLLSTSAFAQSPQSSQTNAVNGQTEMQVKGANGQKMIPSAGTTGANVSGSGSLEGTLHQDKGAAPTNKVGPKTGADDTQNKQGASGN